MYLEQHMSVLFDEKSYIQSIARENMEGRAVFNEYVETRSHLLSDNSNRKRIQLGPSGTTTRSKRQEDK
jgi:hypothetical protein